MHPVSSCMDQSAEKTSFVIERKLPNQIRQTYSQDLFAKHHIK